MHLLGRVRREISNINRENLYRELVTITGDWSNEKQASKRQRELMNTEKQM